jgi:hypothetical protein
MGENLTDALIISVVGMSLVFGAILLLWGVMTVLMRVTTDGDEPAGGEDGTETDRRRRAALAGVAVALARRADQNEPHEFPLPPTAIVTAWQAVQRSQQLTRKGPTR